MNLEQKATLIVDRLLEVEGAEAYDRGEPLEGEHDPHFVIGWKRAQRSTEEMLRNLRDYHYNHPSLAEEEWWEGDYP